MPGVVELRSPAAKTIKPLWSVSLDESAISAAWSADGDLLGAVSASGTVYVYDVATQQCLQQWQSHQFGATAIAWCPQAQLLASAGQDGKVCLWQVGAAAPITTLLCGEMWVEHIAWSSSGRYLAAAAGRKLHLWDQDGSLIHTYPDHPNTIAAIEWASHSDQLISACYGQVQFWLPESSEPQRMFHWKGSMLALAWSPDGRYLCHGNQDSTVHFWIVKSGKELQMWGYPTKIRELAWDHRSRYLATGGGTSITVWDCSGKGPANTKPAVLQYHDVFVSQLSYQRTGPVLVSGCGQGHIAFWEPSKRTIPDATASLPGAITKLAWSPDDELLAATAEDGSLAVYQCP
jgi:WD40 repeat protein